MAVVSSQFQQKKESSEKEKKKERKKLIDLTAAVGMRGERKEQKGWCVCVCVLLKTLLLVVITGVISVD